MSEQITLTPQEIRLIELQREEKRLAEEKKKAEEELKFTKDVLAKEKELTRVIGVISSKNKMLGDAHNQLEVKYPGKFKLRVFTKEITETITKNNYDAERKYIGQTVLWEKTIPTPIYEIELASDKYLRITVQEHLVYGSSYRATNNGLKFHIEGAYQFSSRYYTKVLSAAQKLIEIEQKKAREAAKKDLTTYTITKAREILFERYPNAREILVNNEYISASQYSRRGTPGTYQIKGVIRFQNGFGYSFNINPNSEVPDQPIFIKGSVLVQKNELDCFETLDELQELKELGSK